MIKNFSEIKRMCAFAVSLAICSTAVLYNFDADTINAITEETYKGYTYNQIVNILENSDNLGEFSVERKTITLAEAEKTVMVEFRLDNDNYINNAVFDFVYDANDLILTNIELGDGVYDDDFGHHNVTASFPINVDYTDEHPGASGQLVKLTFKIRDPQAGDRYVINAAAQDKIYRTNADGSETEILPAYNYGYIEIAGDEETTTTAEVTTTAETTTTPKVTTTAETTTTPKVTTTAETTTTTKVTTTAETTTTKVTTTTEATTTTTTTTPSSPQERFVWQEDNWNFTNSHEYFGYGVYNIKKEYLDVLLSQSSNIEKEEILDLQNSSWGGSCYGLAVTSVLSKTSIFNVPKWHSGARYIYDLPTPKQNSDVESIINYYFLTQVTDDIWQERCATDYEPEKTKIERMKKYFADSSNKMPALFCFCCPWWGGHAVVAYDDVEKSGTVDGFSYTGYFKIYDNNCSKYNEEFNFYYNDNGEWIIPYYGINSYYYGAYISLFTADKSLINTHGYFDENGNPKSIGKVSNNTYNDFIASMKSNTGEADFNITKIKNTDDFGAAGDAIDDDEIRISHSMFALGDVSEVDILLKDDTSGYRYQVNDGQTANLELSMRYQNNSFKAYSDKAETVDFLPDGTVSIETVDGNFNLSATFNEGFYSLPWYTVKAVGSKSDLAELKQVDDGFILKGDNLSDIAITANNDNIVAGAGFSTEYDSVLIYAVDDNTVGIKADTDNDGNYETIIETAKYLKGDANSDGIIDVRDVTLIAQNIVKLEDITNIQTMNSDVICDGIVDIKDLGQLKKYLIKVIDKF
ncbi:MAG: dockerin type I repeat-containing protein [Oscillospiraceae bacterium]